jgi:glutathione-independent formaldehyde dehydrogenase
VDCVGFEASGRCRRRGKPAVVLNQAMAITRAGGSINSRLYVTEDPGATDEASKQGSLKIRFGLGWAKSHSFHRTNTSNEISQTTDECDFKRQNKYC